MSWKQTVSTWFATVWPKVKARLYLVFAAFWVLSFWAFIQPCAGVFGHARLLAIFFTAVASVLIDDWLGRSSLSGGILVALLFVLLLWVLDVVERSVLSTQSPNLRYLCAVTYGLCPAAASAAIQLLVKR